MIIPEGATHYIPYTFLAKNDYYKIVDGVLQVYNLHIGWVDTYPIGGIGRFLNHPAVMKLDIEPKVFSYEHT